MRVPTIAIFTCETCGHASTADARMAQHVLPMMRRLPIDESGYCKKCQGGSWTITAQIIEKGVDEDNMEMAMGMGVLGGFVGVGVSLPEKTGTWSADFPGIPADVVAELNADPQQRLMRVGQFVQQIERQRFRDAGGCNCAACNTPFMPVAGVAWNDNGFCSKICQVKVLGASSLPVKMVAATEEPAKGNAIAVQCAAGHSFDVQRSFSGMMRPCPSCGAKTRVP